MSDEKKPTRNEIARKLRREAYQRAKEQRAKDPKYLAMKERAKEQRRALNQKVKEQRKAAAAERKAKETAERAEERAAERTAKDEALKMLLTRPPAKDRFDLN